MAELTCCSIKGFGLETFCVQDYASYIDAQFKKNINIPRVRCNEKFAGMVIFDHDTEETITGFLRMCKWSKPSVVCIDFSNIGTKRPRAVEAIESLIKEMLGSSYVNIDSYEERFSYGLRAECRDWSDAGDLVDITDDSFSS